MPRFFGGRRVLLVVLVLVSASFLIGAGMARRVLARGDDYENLRVFTEVLSLVQSNYVEDMENKKLVEGAIKGMLKTLDPHTSYMPPEMYKEMQVETEGRVEAVRHDFTHFTLVIHPRLVRVVGSAAASEGGAIWCADVELGTAPLPAPMRRIVLALARRGSAAAVT